MDRWPRLASRFHYALMGGLLHGVRPNDPLTFVTVAVVLNLVALAGTVILGPSATIGWTR